MNNATLNAVNAALALVDALMPALKDAFQRGEISAEQQAATRAKYESLRDKLDGQFAGDHWKIE